MHALIHVLEIEMTELMTWYAIVWYTIWKKKPHSSTEEFKTKNEVKYQINTKFTKSL